MDDRSGPVASKGYGDLRDLIARRLKTVGSASALMTLTAFQRSLADVSQNSTLAWKANNCRRIDERTFCWGARGCRTLQPIGLQRDDRQAANLAPDAPPLSWNGAQPWPVAIIADASGFHGLITRVDALTNYGDPLHESAGQQIPRFPRPG